jgi:ribosomal protein S18 acetylase RimI-like enzyme
MHTTLADCDSAALAAAFNAVYAQYVAPFTMTPEQARRHVESTSIDPARSLLWLDDAGAVQAMAALGIRARRGWIGGFGIVPAYRGRGLGHALLRETIEVAARAGLRQIELEVLVDNVAARHVYERGGFRREERDAIGLSGEPRARGGNSGAIGIQPVETGEAIAALAQVRPLAPCWQREGETLRRLPALQGLVAGETVRPAAAMVYRVTDTDVMLADVAARDPQVASALIRRLAADWPGRRMHLSNEPEHSVVYQALLRDGWSERWRQHRMVHALGA